MLWGTEVAYTTLASNRTVQRGAYQRELGHCIMSGYSDGERCQTSRLGAECRGRDGEGKLALLLSLLPRPTHTLGNTLYQACPKEMTSKQGEGSSSLQSVLGLSATKGATP